MAGIKRKQTTEISKPKAKKAKPSPAAAKVSKAVKPVKQASKKPSKKAPSPKSEDFEDQEADTSEDENGYPRFSAKYGSHDSDDSGMSVDEADSEDDGGKSANGKKSTAKKASDADGKDRKIGQDGALGASNSREAHAKQKAIAKERKAAKPNADVIADSKKLWEKLRRKSHVPKEERQKLVAELFDIVTGRVKDLVFKHDSVRIIQTALKYSVQEQRKQIATELKGSFKTLAESRYAKFLVAKLVEEGGADARDIIVPEFYGHVRRLINHPEASWILDDIYRKVATPSQKAIMLREWYGSEFAIFQVQDKSKVTAELSTILKESPEKRKPIMEYLKNLINQLIQKKMTGFTMLHDAMLQYFLNTTPGNEEAAAFLQLITPTPAANKEQKEAEEYEPEIDLLKNLAFTASGSRVVCLAFAYSSAKDRKHMLRAYKDIIELLAYDQFAHRVLLTVYDVFDDTRQVITSVVNELLGRESGEAQQQKVCALATHQYGRVSLLYPFAGTAKWLLPDADLAKIEEVHNIRETTSKKNAETRRMELVKALSPPCLETVAKSAAELIESSFGCQFITEVLLSADGDKTAATNAVAELAKGDPNEEGHIAQSPFAGRMLKTLVAGGKFDPKTKTVKLADSPLPFANSLYNAVKDYVVDWACGTSSLVIVNMIEAEGFEHKDAVLKSLKKERKRLQKAADEVLVFETKVKEEVKEKVEDGKDRKGKKKKQEPKEREPKKRSNVGAKALLEKL